MQELERMTAVQLAQAIRQKKLGVEELTRAYLDRIQRLDGPNGLNAVGELADDALETARKMDAAGANREGALYGLPVLLKDNLDAAGMHTTAGSLALTDNLAQRDAPVVANLRRSGALILGKTHMTEFANYVADGMPSGYSSQGGQVLHAYDRAKDPSGSSSGSAVAVSAGLCAAAVGTDTSFSIVGCATENGIVGYKPPHGVLSGEGIIPIARILDSAGPMTRTLEDALLVYGAMRGSPLPETEPIPACRLRLAVNTYQLEEISAAQRGRYAALVEALEKAGAAVSRVEHPYMPLQQVIMRYAFRHDLEAYLAGTPAARKTLQAILDYYEAAPQQRMPYGASYLRSALEDAPEGIQSAAYRQALAERAKQRAALDAPQEEWDACLMTGPTNIMHFTGLPSLALPMEMAPDGTPRGLILYGKDEGRLLAAAHTIQQYCPGVTPPRLA